MKITSVDIFKVDIELIHPIRVPIGILDAAHNVFIRVNTDADICGWGEASPFTPITFDSQASCLAAAKRLATILHGRDPLDIEGCTRELQRTARELPSIRSAFDMALYDIAGKAADLPVYALLGGENRSLRSDFTIGMQDSIDETFVLLEEGLANGFDAVKLKVGRPRLEDSEEVAAVRERVGPDISVKIDSNQGWDYPTALANLTAMSGLDLQYSEQPTPASQYETLKQLRENTSVRICADESVFNDGDAQTLVDMGAVDYLNIKLGKSGGIHTGQKINAIAEAADLGCMVGCFAESRLGLTATAHLAIARSNIVFIDLDSAYDLKVDPIIGGGSFNEEDGGMIYISNAPGFGAALNDEFIESSYWATV